MAQEKRNKPSIQGIKIKIVKTVVNNVITQFADDTDLFLMYSEECINAAIATLAHIECSTGLKVSYEKTCIYRIGSLHNTEAKCYTIKLLVWSDGDLPMLGCIIKNDASQTNQQFDKTIDKMLIILNTWYLRQLTWMGKVLVVNSLMGSLFVHLMYVLPKMSKKQMGRIEGLIQKFLWKGKRSKINVAVLRNDKQMGGLRLVNLEAKHTAIQLQWINLLEKDESLRCFAYNALNLALSEKIWMCNLEQRDVKYVCTKANSYWTSVLTEWCKLHFSEPRGFEEVSDQIIWLNSHIRINNKPLMPKEHLIQKGILGIKDLLNEQNQFVTYETFIRNTGANINWLDYQNLVQCIPTEWKHWLRNEISIETVTTFVEKEYLAQRKSGTKIYNYIINENGEKTIAPFYKRWVERIEFIYFEEYCALFKRLYLTMNSTKLRNLQYRLLLFKIFTNTTLYKWGILPTENCESCQSKQTVKHLFYECYVTKEIWNIMQKILAGFQEETEWSYPHVMKNDVHSKPGHICNSVVLIAKYFIFQQKCLGQKANVGRLLEEIIFQYKVEKCNMIISNEKILMKWKPVLQQIQLLR